MHDTIYSNVVKKWEEVTELPPQTVGPLTPAYKLVVSKLKVMPLPILVVLSGLLISALYFLVGTGITYLTSILQRGF